MRKLYSLIAAAALVLAGCSGDTGDSGAESSPGPATSSTTTTDAADDATVGQWPRTVTVEETGIEIESAPQRIVALSTETTDLIIELGGADGLVGVSSGSQTEGTGNNVEEASRVEATFRADGGIDPEQIIALDPDLVVLTQRQDNDETLIEVLNGAGITVVPFSPRSFASPEAVADSVTTLGQILGEEEAANEITAGITERTAAVDEALADVDDKPRTLALMARGPQQMIMGQGTATMMLVERAGGTSIPGEEGWQQSVPVDAEVLVSLSPEVILVQDFMGSGMGGFEELLANPALADIPAIANDRVYLIEAQTTSGTSGSHLTTGLEEIAALLHPEIADTVGK